MIQEVAIGKEALEYYEYLDRKYREIVSFLGKTDGAVDPAKVHLYFDMAVVPFSSWSGEGIDDSERIEAAEILSPEGRANLLKALSKKYGLQEREGKYVQRARLQTDRLADLIRKMAQAGYRYDLDSRCFVEVM